MRPVLVLVVLLAALGAHAAAQAFRLEEAAAVTEFPIAQLKPGTVVFSDHRKDELVDPVSGLMRFSDWARTRPLHKQFLAPYAGYEEPTMTTSAGGADRTRRIRLHMYLAEARFVVARGAIDLTRYANLRFLERVDPAIKSRAITPAEAASPSDPGLANRNPERSWCEGGGTILCIESRYKLEGSLPVGILLLNKLRDSDKKVADFIEFQSELRVLSPGEIDQAGLRSLTALDAPVAGVLEQTIFRVNQIMPFGKFMAVLQNGPDDGGRTIVTAFIALAVESDLLEKKKEYERVPVLRNLVPAQVLAGKSSFNTGNSISAGLPSYARNRIKAIADILERDQAR